MTPTANIFFHNDCLAGARIVNIPKVSFGGGGCSAGGAQYLIEELCLLKEVCEILVRVEEFDPTDYTCRGLPAATRTLAVAAECALP